MIVPIVLIMIVLAFCPQIILGDTRDSVDATVAVSKAAAQ
jgi:hypothetical protein